MDKNFDHKTKEPEIYKLWEDNDLFSPEGVAKIQTQNNIANSKRKPWTLLMPPPNANAALHVGHVTYSIQDLMIRFKRMQGFDALYLPGTDHAGFETQYVYERNLKKIGKSRFDFDRETLYQNVLDFVKENADMAISQLKRLGMSADWNRNTFMLDKKVIDTVYDTFIKMHNDGLVYKSGYMVNYSTFYGTTFSDLETEYKESVSPLYYVKYKICDKSGKVENGKFITVATVRPETIYADVAIAINPKDNKMREFQGKYAVNPFNGKVMPIIEDDYVDPKFGTGALKITPGHDINDYKIGQKHGLEVISLINLDGKMNEHSKECEGMFPKQARVKCAEILQELGALEKIDEKYTNNVLVDYKDNQPIEPMVLQNWFVDTSKLFDPVIDAINKDEVKFYRPTWKKEALRWLKEKKPWPISRQTVFGIRIPVWYSINDNQDMLVTFIPDNAKSANAAERPSGLNTVSGKISELLKSYKLDEIKSGLQKVITLENAKYVVSIESPGFDYLPETDTFDTWFSSGQWPLTTTGYPNGEDFKKYFPTDFMDTAWEILFFWIARMIMFSKYLTGKIPFKLVYIHGLITDSKGIKMSKSRGNTINPLDVVGEFGADALRMGILAGSDTSARLTPASMDKIRGYRNFANKIWNIARYIEMQEELLPKESKRFGTDKLLHHLDSAVFEDTDKSILQKLNTTIENVTKNIEKYKYNLAGDEVYHFIWDDLANLYLEQIKSRLSATESRGEVDFTALFVLKYCFLNAIKLLHPFMPFITETVWQELVDSSKESKDSEPYLISAKWPKVSSFK